MNQYVLLFEHFLTWLTDAVWLQLKNQHLTSRTLQEACTRTLVVSVMLVVSLARGGPGMNFFLVLGAPSGVEDLSTVVSELGCRSARMGEHRHVNPLDRGDILVERIRS